MNKKPLKLQKLILLLIINIFWKKMLKLILPKTNIVPENGWLEDRFLFEMALFYKDMLFLEVYFFFYTYRGII